MARDNRRDLVRADLPVFRDGALTIYRRECQGENAYKFAKMLSNREAN
jgi:hypothetical protein